MEVSLSPCRRGHTTPRNRFGQCAECLRESRRAYKKSHPRSAPPPPPEPLAAPEPAAAAVPHSFLAVAREFLESKDDVRASTAKKRAYLLDQLTALHPLPMAELTTATIVQALKAIEAVRDRRETAHRCGQLVGQITRYAVQHSYAKFNVLPDGDLRGALKPVKTQSHPAIIDPQRFGTFLHFIDLYTDFITSRAQPGVAPALQLAPLVFIRPGELRQLEWSEVSFDKEEVTLPPEKMKMKRPHIVPLSTQALAILRKVHQRTSGDKFVFRTKRRDEPLSDNGFREALRTILGAMGAPRDAHSIHGFRASASTLLNGELGIDSALIELQLAHAKADKVAGIYDRSQRIPERKQMMQQWADYLDRLKTEK